MPSLSLEVSEKHVELLQQIDSEMMQQWRLAWSIEDNGHIVDIPLLDL